MGVGQEVFFVLVLYQPLYVKCDRGHFWPQEHNLNKLGRGPLDDISYQIARLYGHVVSNKKISKVLPL